MPRAARREGPDPPRRPRRRVRIARGHPHADPRLPPGAADRTAGEVLLWTGGVLPRARAPTPVAHLDPPRREPGRPARRRHRASDVRWRRVRVVVARRARQRGDVRRRTVRGAARTCGGDGRLHEQPAVRRDAGIRRAAGLLCPRGPDGQARGRARHGSGRDPAPERVVGGIGAADRSGPCRRGAGARGDRTVRRDPASRRGSGLRPGRDRLSRRDGQRHARRGRPAGNRLRGRLQERRFQRGIRRCRGGARDAQHERSSESSPRSTRRRSRWVRASTRS